MRCPLCGYEFDAAQMTCHTSCTFNQQCAVICCPNCGYQMLDESKSRIAGWLRKRLARSNVTETSATPVMCPLSKLRPGQSGTVVSVDTTNTHRQEKLSVLGVIPGATVTLRQRLPTYVLQVGYTELSIEREVADDILVKTQP
jgi:Fe2+ transport system protein FeoA